MFAGISEAERNQKLNWYVLAKVLLWGGGQLHMGALKGNRGNQLLLGGASRHRLTKGDGRQRPLHPSGNEARVV